MIQIKLTLVSVLLLFFPGLLAAQDEERSYSIDFSGFISYESIFDTRQTVAAREGEVLLYPAAVSDDASGDDINAQHNFNMFVLHSRFRANVSGPEVLGAQSGALLEVDFVGNTNSVISMTRLRHSIITLDWERASLLAGQYWHPFFVTSSYPEVSGWGGGLPFAVLSRNPQLRFTYALSDAFSVGITALTQRDFSTDGPLGGSPEYLRNSGMPEMNLQLDYKGGGWNIGAVGGIKTIRPRLTDFDEQKLDETLSSWQSKVYLRKDIADLTLKLSGLYGQNMHNFLMIGGYAEFFNTEINEETNEDIPTDFRGYENRETLSVWTEWLYTSGAITYSVFGGYTENLGFTEEPADGIGINYYGRGSHIGSSYRVAPRLTLQVEEFQIMGEVMYSEAAYGDIQADGTVSNTEAAGNVRLQLHLKYSF